ncbi:transcription antitermination factor NusG [Pedobacter psychrotolerans]|uniref:Transcription antitermination factor NusG n=1 Tax=Pedobacter psychrotolerans TaxID=1843235 RepID=A0A4R2HLB3_9SPHI|nr:UpxY family transcription antiterminator [Pedobacter psychrotolerans]TCO30808.1 transcription antitermination factor NusG [Pedobacter psychrotolerans]GGE44303.1 transcription antitermination protein NusG [Pedobacter psychrotolerans]
MIDNSYRWYPVYTRSRAEKKAFDELNRKGITAYLPLHKTLKQWSDRKKFIEEPLLKSYLFVYISSKEYAEVLMTNGIARFLYFSGKVASMPEQQIEHLKRLLATEHDLEVFDYDIKPGQKVLVKAGPFKDMVAELISLQNKQRIILRLANIGYSIDINTSIAFVEPI